MRHLGRLLLLSSILFAAVPDAGASGNTGPQKVKRFRPKPGTASAPGGRGVSGDRFRPNRSALRRARAMRRPSESIWFRGGRPHFDDALAKAQSEIGHFRTSVTSYYDQYRGPDEAPWRQPRVLDFAVNSDGEHALSDDGLARGIQNDRNAIVVKRVKYNGASWTVHRARVVELMLRRTDDPRTFVPEFGKVTTAVSTPRGRESIVTDTDEIVMPFFEGATEGPADDITDEEITRAAVTSFVLGHEHVTRADVIVDRQAEPTETGRGADTPVRRFTIVGWDRSNLGTYQKRPGRRKSSPFREHGALGLEPKDGRTRYLPTEVEQGLQSLSQLSDEVLGDSLNMKAEEIGDFRERINLVLKHGIDKAMEMKGIGIDD